MRVITQDVREAILARRTIRAYRPDPVPKDVLTELLDLARYTPSWGNTQPWEFAVAGGEVWAQLKEAMLQRFQAGTAPYPDIPLPVFPEGIRARSGDNGRRMLEAMGISREDREPRRRWSDYGATFFGAPNGIFLHMDRSLGPWSVLDIGMTMQTIMIAAVTYGLGTSPLFVMVRYPDVLREMLSIPESQQIVCGIAIGYPDTEAPQNNFERPRLPLESVATWHGFED